MLMSLLYRGERVGRTVVEGWRGLMDLYGVAGGVKSVKDGREN